MIFKNEFLSSDKENFNNEEIRKFHDLSIKFIELEFFYFESFQVPAMIEKGGKLKYKK